LKKSTRAHKLLACLLGASLAIGTLFSLYIPTGNSGNWVSSKTGISQGQLILLDYFIFMPWPVSNLMEIPYFAYVDYDDPVEEDGTAFAWFHSLFFFVGALLAVALSGEKERSEEVELRWKQWKGISLPPSLSLSLQGHPPPWMLYTLLTLVFHLILIGAAMTHYTGPGGPVWVYPSPIYLLPFTMGIFVISYLAKTLYTGLRQGFNSK